MVNRVLRCRGATVLLLALAAAGCSEPASYAGVWKVDCGDYWGVQIRPAAAGLYHVTFCGLSGCMPPGTWMPDTRIAGDPLFEIESATRIRIKRKDSGDFLYLRCSTDPTWQARAPK